MSKPKFNFMDFLIIIGVVGIIAGGWYFLSAKTSGRSEGKETNVVFAIEETQTDAVVAESYSKNIKVGDRVFVGTKEKIAGRVKSLEITPSKVLFENPKTGEKSYLDSVSRFDVMIEIEASVTESESDFKVGSTILKIGKKQNFNGKGFSGYGYVVALDKAEEETAND